MIRWHKFIPVRALITITALTVASLAADCADHVESGGVATVGDDPCSWEQCPICGLQGCCRSWPCDGSSSSSGAAGAGGQGGTAGAGGQGGAGGK